MTGAGGFLGARTVEALVHRGHEVRALVRPAAAEPSFGEGVDVRRADLRDGAALGPLLDGIDAVVHLAAQVTGGDEARFTGTVATTENLLGAMAAAGARRLVLASSFSVYDWSLAGGEISEGTPLEREPVLYERDGYAVAKWWQEKVVRRAAERVPLELTVLRPGFVWGPANDLVDGVGPRLGWLQFVIAPAGRLPLTHVDNCADCFAAAVDCSAAAGATLNVVDGDAPRRWRYARAARASAIRVPVPYFLAFGMVRVVHRAAKVVLGERMKLPSIFVPRRFEARFKPVRANADAARRVLNWRPPLKYEEVLRK